MRKDVEIKRSGSSNGAACVYALGNAFKCQTWFCVLRPRVLWFSFHACDLRLSSGPFKHQRPDTCTHVIRPHPSMTLQAEPAFPGYTPQLTRSVYYTVLLGPDSMSGPGEHKTDCMNKHCVCPSKSSSQGSLRWQMLGFVGLLPWICLKYSR